MANNCAQILVVLAILFLHEREKRAEMILMGVPIDRAESMDGEFVDLGKGKAANA